MEHTERDHVKALVARFVRRRWGVPLQIFAASTAAVFVLGAALLQEDDAPEPAPAPVETRGVVESLYRRPVGSRFDGTVASVAVRDGQAVKKGQLLFRMDTTWVRGALAAARTERSAAAAALRELKAQRNAETAAIAREISALKGQLAASPAPPPAAEGEQWTDDPDWQPAAYAEETTAPAPEEIAAQLETLSGQLRERAAAWAPVLRTASQRMSAAGADVARYSAMLKQAERRSPITGIVTAVNAQPGTNVGAGQPVVQVDNPDGFRVVALLDKKAVSRVKKGSRLPLEGADSPTEGRVEKIVAGWDKDLFRYWVWVKPEEKDVQPGETLEVVIPAGTHVASR
jgi:HlyD family secretion protein